MANPIFNKKKSRDDMKKTIIDGFGAKISEMIVATKLPNTELGRDTIAQYLVRSMQHLGTNDVTRTIGYRIARALKQYPEIKTFKEFRSLLPDMQQSTISSCIKGSLQFNIPFEIPGGGSGGGHQVYSDEFKNKIVNQALIDPRRGSYTKIAKENDLHPSLVSNWIKLYNKKTADEGKGKTLTDDRGISNINLSDEMKGDQIKQDTLTKELTPMEIIVSEVEALKESLKNLEAELIATRQVIITHLHHENGTPVLPIGFLNWEGNKL